MLDLWSTQTRKPILLSILLTFVLVLFAACASRPRARVHQPPPAKGIPPTQRPYEILGEMYYPIPSAEGFVEEGIASWYGPDFHCKATACGEVYDMDDFTAAHKILPMQTYVRVLNLENGAETMVRINDRGPFVKGRIIDLSLAAAKDIGMYGNGTSLVRIEALGTPVEVNENGRKVKRLVQTVNYKAGDFWIQVGAFTDKGNAERLKDSLGREYGRIDIQLYDRGDALFYRVQVFAATDLDAARGVERQVGTRFPNAFLVAR